MEIQNSIFNYATLLKQVKARVALAQKKAIYSANEEMLSMYWDIGKLLCESQKQIGWGNNALEQLANDLKNDYPKVKGFSPRNCRCMIQFHKEYNQELTIWQPVVAKLEMSNCVLPIKQLSWSHNITLIQRVKDLKAVEFMLAGATAIQIGTANFIDPAVTIKVEDGINNYLERHGCKSVKEIIGALEV